MTKPRIQMIGLKFGKLTALKQTTQTKFGSWRYYCICECGEYTDVDGANLRKGAVKSCGCLRFSRIQLGTRFGQLVVVRKQGKDSLGCAKYLCKCDCGNTKVIRGYSLERGDSKGCGCQSGKHLFKHGLSGTKEYHLLKSHRRYAKKLKAKGSHTIEEIFEKLKNQNYRCYYCETNIKKKYHRDHITPLIHGGSDDISNIALACPRCNLRKSTMPAKEFISRLKGKCNEIR